jgi:hypothetical protein
VCARLDDIAPLPPEDFEKKIESVIERGYFKSKPFLGVLALLALAVGIGGVRLYDVGKQMQQRVDEARQQVEQGLVQVENSRKEVANNAAEIKNRQAEVALNYLKGEAELTQAQKKAADDLQQKEKDFESTVTGEKKRWLKEATEKDEPDAVRTIDEAANQAKADLAKKTASTVLALEATKSPWIPFVVWSMAKGWFLIPAALIAVALGMVSNVLLVWGRESKSIWAIALSVFNLVIGCVILGAVVWLKYFG